MLVDNSTLSAFSKCHVAGALRYWLHRKSNTQRLASQLGTSAHAIAKHYLAGEVDLYDHITQELNVLRKCADESGVDIKYRQETLSRFQSIFTNMVAAYPIRLTNDGPVIFTRDRKIPRYYVRHQEIGFTLPIADGRHTLMGSIDAIIEDDNNNWRIWELKTSRYCGSDLWRSQWRLSTQLLTYEYVAHTHTNANVLGTLVIPFNTTGLDCRAEPIIEIEHTPSQLNQWLSDVITYLDWLSAIADDAGITFDSDGRSQLPFAWTDDQLCEYASRVIARIIPTGRFCGNCANMAFGKCDYYSICQTNYLPQFIESTTHMNVWDPRATHVSPLG